MEATKLQPVVALFGQEAVLCPPGLAITNDLDAYGPVVPGAIVQIARGDLTETRWTRTWAVVLEGPNYKHLVTVYALRKVRSIGTLVTEENAAELLGVPEEDIVQMGNDLKCIPDGGAPQRDFHSGLERMKVNIKTVIVPRNPPSEEVCRVFEDALEDIEGLSVLYANDLKRFRDDKIAPGGACKIVQGPMSGHIGLIEEPYEAHPKIPGRFNVVLYKGTKRYRLSTKPSYIRDNFVLFDEVSGEARNGKLYVGWLVKMVGRKAFIWDIERVSRVLWSWRFRTDTRSALNTRL